VGGAPRGEGCRLGVRKASPLIGPPTKRGVRWVVLLVGGAPRGEGAGSVSEKLRPEVGPQSGPPAGLVHRLGHGVDKRLQVDGLAQVQGEASGFGLVHVTQGAIAG
jgi:hypothetical protein